MVTTMLTSTATTETTPRARDISTITVAMAPGPASSGIASGTMATSSLAVASWASSGEVRVSDCRARSMSSAVMSRTMPPATRKALRLTPTTLKRKVPNRAKNTSSAAATREARRAVSAQLLRRVPLGHGDEDGHHADRIDDEEDRRERHQRRGDRVAHRIFHTMASASSTMARDILDCPTRRSSKTMGTSTTRKPFRMAR